MYLFNDLTFKASSTQLTRKPAGGRCLDTSLELDLAKHCGSLPRGGGVSTLRDAQSSAGLWTLEVGLATSRGPPSITVSVIPVVVVMLYSGHLSSACTVHADVILHICNANQNTEEDLKLFLFFCCRWKLCTAKLVILLEKEICWWNWSEGCLPAAELPKPWLFPSVK